VATLDPYWWRLSLDSQEYSTSLCHNCGHVRWRHSPRAQKFGWTRPQNCNAPGCACIAPILWHIAGTVRTEDTITVTGPDGKQTKKTGQPKAPGKPIPPPPEGK